MPIIKGKKESFIEELNKNYRTILSYGNDGLVPVGEFIVKDILEDEIPVENANNKSKLESCKIVLAKVDEENVEIVLPMEMFLKKYTALSIANADKLSIGSDLTLSLQDVERNAKSKVMSDETLQETIDVETISLEESNADYLINGEIQSLNYSLCPVNLGKYRERIREYINNSKEFER